jgi:hypothetical protein
VRFMLIPIVFLTMLRLMERAMSKYEHTIDITGRWDTRLQMHRQERLTYELDAIARRNIQERWTGHPITNKRRAKR